MKIFVTGDRSMPTEVALSISAHVIAELATVAALSEDPLYLVTGCNQGVEDGVARIAGVLGFEIEKVGQQLDPSTGKPDWDARHREIVKFCEQVVVIHPDVLDSRIGASCIRIVPDEKLTLVGG